MSPAQKASGPPRPASWPLDPAWVAIFGAALVLVLAIVWLGRAPSDAPDVRADAAAAARLAVIEQRVAELAARPAPDLGAPDLRAVERRVAAIEARPAPAAPDLSPLQQRFAALEPRVADAAQQAEARAAALEPRIAAALQAAQQAVSRAAALEPRIAEAAQGFTQRLAALEPQVAAAAQAGRDAAAALEPRILEAAQAGRQAATSLEPRIAEAAQAGRQAAAALEPRIAEVAQASRDAVAALEPRIAEARQAGRDAAAALEPRIAEAAQAARQAGERAEARIVQLEQVVAAARASAEQSASRTATFEGEVRQLREAAARAERALVARAAALAVEGGRPLGDLVGRLGQTPPAALARYADAPPPTPAGLRAAFEDASRAARGPGSDELLPRLQGLVTVRRGNETLWGPESETSLDRARAALAEGNIEEAVAQVGRLPERAREAMRPWTEQAEALIAARAALRNLQAG